LQVLPADFLLTSLSAIQVENWFQADFFIIGSGATLLGGSNYAGIAVSLLFSATLSLRMRNDDAHKLVFKFIRIRKAPRSLQRSHSFLRSRVS
jgi:hypothetical protein